MERNSPLGNKLLLCVGDGGGGGGGVGRIFSPKFLWKKLVFFFSFFFFMCLAQKRNDFNFFCSSNKPKIELPERKWTQKLTFLAKFVKLTPAF